MKRQKTAAFISSLKPIGYMFLGAIVLVIGAYMVWLTANWDVQQKCLMYPDAVRQTPISIQVTLND